MSDSKFPSGFLWGAATSSHQIEGQNTLNDWWRWEQAGRVAESSGDACDSYIRFEEDFDLARTMGHNAHRFSIEWSRVEPREGEWDERAIAHYREVVAALKARGIEPLVTLHHFTNPAWMAAKGGWENPHSPKWFARYASKIAETIGHDIRWWMTINEPMVFIFHGYLSGWWTPGKKSFAASLRVTAHMAQAHCLAYAVLHDIHRRNAWAKPKVGLAHAMQVYEPKSSSLRDRLAVFLRFTMNNRLFLRLVRHSSVYLPATLFGTGGSKQTIDFIGLNYYFREILDASGPLKGWMSLTGEPSKSDPRFVKAEKSDLEWEIYPEGIYDMLMELKRYDVPLMVTENGICTSDDNLRARFIYGHLKQVKRAMDDGAPVVGFQYWSLLDNFEWAFGFKPRFGLVHVDYATQKRTIKPSGDYYAQICRTGELPAEGPAKEGAVAA